MDINLPLVIASIFISTYGLGRLLEKIRIPWIFAALLLGVIASFYNPFEAITSQDSFKLLSDFGLYFTLFILGYEIDIFSLRKQGKFIIKTSILVILAEALVGTWLLHSLFAINWPTAALVATSFATVGEAVLLPILDEFNLLKNKLGQAILGVGVVDDIVEIATIFIVTLITGNAIGSGGTGNGLVNILLILLVLAVPIALYRLHTYLTRGGKKYGLSYFFLFAMALLFLLIGIGQMIEATALASIMAGVVLKNSLPDQYHEAIETQLKALAYGFFGPIFFFSVGLDTSFANLGHVVWLIIVITLATSAAKIVVSYFAGRNYLGKHESIIMGISLTVRLSTSIVVITILYQHGLIPLDLFSVLIGSTVLFKFVNPPLLAYLIQKWKIGKPDIRSRKTISLSERQVAH